MNLERIVAGTSYLPARGITFITDGVIDEGILSAMMTNPDEFCDSDHDGIVAPYRLEANGCPRRPNFDPPCRLNFDPGRLAEIA